MRYLGLAAVVVLGGCLMDFTEEGDAASAECGNGTAETGESCDGTDLAGQTCLSLGLGAGMLTCQANCLGYVTQECGPPGCGNGVMNAGTEECDGGDLGSATCVSEGFAGGDLTCSVSCLLDNSLCERFSTGAECDEDEHCVGGLCWTEGGTGYPSGFCTGECEYTSECDTGEACVTGPEGGTGNCYPTCVTDQSCRPGYACFDYYETWTSVCWPHCLDSDDCPFSALCNLWTGRCEALDPDLADNGSLCADASECLGEHCLRPTATSPGSCASPCAVSDGECPANSVCVPWPAPGLPGDLGMCLRDCTSASDCEAGLDCYDAFSVGMLVCWP